MLRMELFKKLQIEQTQILKYEMNELAEPKHLITTQNMSLIDLDNYFFHADKMQALVKDKGGDDRLKHKVLALAFYEPSTRTSCSFQAAMLRLGGSTIFINDTFSSVKKGETLEDTIKTLGIYADAIVLRHPIKGSSKKAAKVSEKPIINAGDGEGEHPTQALLDVYTIYKEFRGNMPGITITFVGDLKYSRTVHSLVKLVALFSDVKIIFVNPPGLEIPSDIIDFLHIKGLQPEYTTMNNAIEVTDVLYMTRIQRERIMESVVVDTNLYRLDEDLMKRAKQRMIVMHPLPRNDEISTEIDHDPRVAYFRQMEYGLYIRMALLESILTKTASS